MHTPSGPSSIEKEYKNYPDCAPFGSFGSFCNLLVKRRNRLFPSAASVSLCSFYYCERVLHCSGCRSSQPVSCWVCCCLAGVAAIAPERIQELRESGSSIRSFVRSQFGRRVAPKPSTRTGREEESIEEAVGHRRGTMASEDRHHTTTTTTTTTSSSSRPWIPRGLPAKRRKCRLCSTAPRRPCPRGSGRSSRRRKCWRRRGRCGRRAGRRLP